MTLILVFDILLISALLLVSRRLLGASDLFQATVLFISFGLFLSLAWIRLQAPDIALVKAAVGAGLAGVLLFRTFKAVEPGLDESDHPSEPEPCRLDSAAACPSKMHYLLAGLFVGIFTLLLVLAILELPSFGNGLISLVAGSLEQSGVEHPVTAVMFNFWLDNHRNEYRLMSTFHLYAIAAMLLVGLGVHGLLVRRHLLRKVMALNIIAGGVFLLLISTAYRNKDAFPDPVPQAMVLIGIVAAISATGFALALVRRIHERQAEQRNDRPVGHSEQKEDR